MLFRSFQPSVPRTLDANIDKLINSLRLFSRIKDKFYPQIFPVLSSLMHHGHLMLIVYAKVRLLKKYAPHIRRLYHAAEEFDHLSLGDIGPRYQLEDVLIACHKNMAQCDVAEDCKWVERGQDDRGLLTRRSTVDSARVSVRFALAQERSESDQTSSADGRNSGSFPSSVSPGKFCY